MGSGATYTHNLMLPPGAQASARDPGARAAGGAGRCARRKVVSMRRTLGSVRRGGKDSPPTRRLGFCWCNSWSREVNRDDLNLYR